MKFIVLNLESYAFPLSAFAFLTPLFIGCLKNAKGSRNVLKCAVCRKDTPLTKNGITDIPKNLVVAGLLQMIKKVIHKLHYGI